MVSKETMYIILDEKQKWIYYILDDLDDAIATARMLNDEENQKYHHYVVTECTRQYGEMWLQAWRNLL